MAIDLSKILPKISDMPERRILIFPLDKYNLQTKTVSFPDHGNLLKEGVVRLALLINVNKA